MTGFQPRYVAYARSQGRTPAQQQAAVAESNNLGYVLWINARWREWDQLTGHNGSYSDADHENFDAWLQQVTR